jgi:hypothetical protein
VLARAGLPDGIYAYKKSQFWYILEGFEMENVGVGILLPFLIPRYVTSNW